MHSIQGIQQCGQRSRASVPVPRGNIYSTLNTRYGLIETMNLSMCRLFDFQGFKKAQLASWQWKSGASQVIKAFFSKFEYDMRYLKI